MKEQDAANSFGGEKKLACKKAIQCLYIVVDESVASDVDNKVSAFVHQLETELTRLRSELQQERNRIRTLQQTLIARFYNNPTFNKDSLSKIIDEVGGLLK